FYEDEVDIDLNPKLGADWMFRAQQKRLVTPGQNAMNRPWFSRHFVAEKGVVSQINHQATTAPAPGDRYTRGFLT
ncbi:hypothetical protein Q7I33_20905, partial [Aeromonas allosaccharophila]